MYHDFVDEKAITDGYEAAVLKAIDENYRPQVWVHWNEWRRPLIESGKYDIGNQRSLHTVKNAPRNLSFQKNQSSKYHRIYRMKRRCDKYKNIDDFVSEREIVQFLTNKMRSWNVIEEYNEKHKDQQIELTAAESFKVADAYAWVLKRYDASLTSNFPLKSCHR